MKNKSYLSRAKSWWESAEDITVETLQQVIGQVTLKLKTLSLSPDKDESIQNDLQKTLEFLNDELKTLVGVDKLPEANAEQKKVEQEISAASCDYEFDPSPLINYNDVEVIQLAPDEKARRIAELKRKIAIVPARNLAV